MVTTNHNYINTFPVKDTDTSLILGTIHPHDRDAFKIDFFYGNQNSIWKILASALPDINFDSKELIVSALSNSNIWISDMISSCDREDKKVTQDRLLENIKLNDTEIKNGILKSKISEIFFTSGFGKNNAAKLFCDKFSIKAELNDKREFDIPESKFGRKIKGIVLFSPSGQANIGISQNKLYLELKEHYNGCARPVNQFKIDFYREAFKKQFNKLK
jgi:hypothetical protein